MQGRRTILHQWVIDQGGTKAVSEMLGISVHTINRWTLLGYYPNSLPLYKIIKASKGVLTLENVIQSINSTRKRKGLHSPRHSV